MAFWKPGESAPAVIEDRETAAEGTLARYNPLEAFSIQQQRSSLPIASFRRKILFAVEHFAVTVVVGETGCGKTTQIPQFLYEAGWTAAGGVVACTQPRRVAAMTVAARVAEEMRCSVGQEVGYCVKFAERFSTRTKILFQTDGMLLREVLLDPLLSRYSVIVVDEAHERTRNTDVLLALLKKILKQRPKLRVIVSSATLDSEKIERYFHSKNSPATTLFLPGRMYPVDVLYAEEPVSDFVKASVESVTNIHREQPPGDILVFLPGEADIADAEQMLQDQNLRGLAVYPLHSSLPWAQQLKAIEPVKRNVRGQPAYRKCILSTNIAETSVTIDGVVYIVDSGFVKLPVFDPIVGVEALVVTPVSKAAATQRAGRAGRVRAGQCYRLYTEEAFHNLQDSTPAEIVRSTMTETVLSLKAMGIHNIVRFNYLDAPAAESVIRACEQLFALGALDVSSSITNPLGIYMAEMPVEPKQAAMLLASLRLGCAEEISTIAAMTSVSNIWIASRRTRSAVEKGIIANAAKEGDHCTYVNVYNRFISNRRSRGWCVDYGLSHTALSRAHEIRGQLLAYLNRICKSATVADLQIASCEGNEELIRKCVTSGYFNNVAKLEPDGSYSTLRDSRRVELHPESVLTRVGSYPEWVVFHESVLTDVEYMRDVSAINVDWLLELAPHYYEHRDPLSRSHNQANKKARLD